MLYEFKLYPNAMEGSKNICYAKGESTVNHSTVTRLFKKVLWCCKNLDNQERSGRAKSEDIEIVLLAIEAK